MAAVKPDSVLKVEAVMNAAISGKPLEVVTAAAKDLITSQVLTAPEFLAVFPIIPRPAAAPFLSSFIEAEGQLGRNDLSKDLIASDFQGLGPFDTPTFLQCCAAVVARTPASAAQFRWRVHVLKHAAIAAKAGVDVAAVATAAVAYALRTPSFLFFAPLVDALRAADAVAKGANAAKLADALEACFVTATGAAALQSALPAFQAAAAPQPLDVAALERRARMLKLCVALQGKSTTTFAEVAAALELGSDAKAAQNVVLDAATANLVDVRIESKTATVRVHSVAPLRFDGAAWTGLKKQFDDMIAFTDALAKQYGLPDVK
jgi:hypothetical protein